MARKDTISHHFLRISGYNRVNGGVMHELSIAVGLIEIAEEAARRAGAERIYSLRVSVGALSGVVIEALEFAYPAAAEDTMCEGATLEIEPVPARIRCRVCGHEAEMEGLGPFTCPAPGCGAPGAEVIAGYELDLMSMEVEQEEHQHEAANT